MRRSVVCFAAALCTPATLLVGPSRTRVVGQITENMVGAMQLTERPQGRCGPRIAGVSYGGNTALVTGRRNQATTITSSDKKFHCSICKKSFRLEMAAKLHIQQSHGGEGAVEAGPGPGQDASAEPAVPVHNAPPTAPTAVGVPSYNTVDDDEDRYRRSRPTPKPLHEPVGEVPAEALSEMLAVWDKIGLSRLEGEFVHSTMIMKVYAAKPDDSQSRPKYQSLIPEPEGENPFAVLKASGLGHAAGTPRETEGEAPQAVVDPSDLFIRWDQPFAFAGPEANGPFQPAAVENPFVKTTPSAGGAGKREVTSARGAPSMAARRDDSSLTAPVTPYGQLPMFGRTPTPAARSEPAVSTPTAGATSAEERQAVHPNLTAPGGGGVSHSGPDFLMSPFLGQVQVTAAPEQVSSPFAASIPIASVVGTPSTPPPPAAAASVPKPSESTEREGPSMASPFAAAAAKGFASPFAAAPSPFLPNPSASPFTPSPFQTGTEMGVAASMPVDTNGAAALQYSDGYRISPPEPVPEVKFDCELCGKSFHTEQALCMHSKAKHNVKIRPKGGAAKLKERAPELPAYIPSPVDLATTSPFGSSSSLGQAWTEVEMTPHALCVSNITLVGKVLDVDESSSAHRDVMEVAVFVASEQAGEDETVTVRCFGQAAASLKGQITRNATVVIHGTLRLHPVYENANNRYYMTPIVHVAHPMGMMSLVE